MAQSDCGQLVRSEMDRFSAMKSVVVVTSTIPRWCNDAQPAFVLELCRRMTERFDVVVLAPHAHGAARAETLDGVRVRRFRYAPARLETVAYGSGMRGQLAGNPLRGLLIPFFFLAEVVALGRMIGGRGADVVHAHWLVPQGLAAVLARACLGSDVPIVCTSHGGDLFALQRWPWSWLKRVVLRRVDAVTVVSSAMRDEVERLVPQRRAIHVMPMGTDLREGFVPPVQAERAPAELLFVGRLVPKKGLAFLVRVLAQLACQAGCRPRLRVVGVGPEEDVVRALAIDEGVSEQLEFCGFRSHAELPALFQRCTAAVFPFQEERGGDQEGFGLVVVEALGCACPVIASDLPAVRDVIGDGSHMRAVSPNDVQGWVDAIRHVLDDPDGAARMGVAGREWVAPRFDWSTCADGYARLLEGFANAERSERG